MRTAGGFALFAVVDFVFVYTPEILLLLTLVPLLPEYNGKCLATHAIVVGRNIKVATTSIHVSGVSKLMWVTCATTLPSALGPKAGQCRTALADSSFLE